MEFGRSEIVRRSALLEDDDPGLIKRMSEITDFGLRSLSSCLILAGSGIRECRNVENRGMDNAISSGGVGTAILFSPFLS